MCLSKLSLEEAARCQMSEYAGLLTYCLLLLPGTYKIPTANDIPLDLRVTLLRDAPCERTPQVHSSKAVGEPPLFLGASVFYALKVWDPS